MSDPQAGSPPPGGGYEKSDFTLRPVVTFAVVLGLAVAGVLLLMLWMLDFFAARQPGPTSPAPAPSAAVRSGPPEPRLQVGGSRPLEAMRRAEEARLAGYGWVDRQAGTVHIPIARAMDLLLERGLPGGAAAARPAERPGRRGR